MPSASVAVIAGRPSLVAGILMNRLGRSTRHHSAFASATVFSVSLAIRGSTSMDTRPSRPPEASKAGRSTSQAQRMSKVVMSRAASSTVSWRTARSCTWSL